MAQETKGRRIKELEQRVTQLLEEVAETKVKLSRTQTAFTEADTEARLLRTTVEKMRDENVRLRSLARA